MESANHEFTWLSGRAHESVAHEAQSCSSSISKSKKPSVKPTPTPRQENSSTSSSEKPAALPRVFTRAESRIPVYEVPPALPNSVFYVSTPKTADSHQKPSESSPKVPMVHKSVILEFDPILQKSNSGDRRSTFYIDAFDSENSASEAPTLPLGNFSSGQESRQNSIEGHSSSSEHGHNLPTSRSVSRSTSVDSESPRPALNNKPKRTASTSSSLSNLSKNSEASLSSTSSVSTTNRVVGRERQESFSPSTNPTSSPRNCGSLTKSAERAEKMERGKLTTNSQLDTSCSSLPPVPMPRSQVSPQSENSNTLNKPTPKPRLHAPAKHASPELLPKTNANKPKCTLSTVPPAPQPFSQSEVAPTNRDSSISVENPFYMFVESEGQSPSWQTEVEQREDGSSSESESSSDVESLPEYGPPSFPPPPPPTLSEVKSSAESEIHFHSNSMELDTVEPSSAFGASIVNLMPNSSEISVVKSDRLDNLEPVPAHSLTKEFPLAGCMRPDYPIYHNLLELSNCYQEGVYAKINKVLPPPLPPRQRKQNSPPPRIYPHPSTNLSRPTLKPPLNDEKSSASGKIGQRESLVVDEVRPSIPHQGVLYKIERGRTGKDVSQKWIVLANGNFYCYADDKAECLQESFDNSTFVSIARAGPNAKHSQEFSCFELVTKLSKDRVQVFGARYLSECEMWIQQITRALAPRKEKNTNRDIIKAGNVEVRLNSVTGVWQQCWFVLSGKQLDICIKDEKPLTLDLRKVILLQDFDKDPRMSDSDIECPVFLVNYPAVTMYVRTEKPFETNDWLNRLRSIMSDTGPGLDEQHMTHEGVPVIIDKCIKFVSTYGITTQGIYRHGATVSRVDKLLANFQRGAQKVHLQPDDYNEYEVANALKRYLRNLPDSLLTGQLYPQWIAAAEVKASVEHYQTLLTQLPDVNFKTLKKIIGHLYSISEHSKENLMTITNLAQVFGPTLLSSHEENASTLKSRAILETEVTCFLIENYKVLFEVSEEEIRKEEQILRALQELRLAKKAQKPAGDILVGIYIYDRQWGKCINIKLSPTMTALDMCKVVMVQASMRGTVQSFSIFEVVCDGCLERPLHHTEYVLSVILRWANWPNAEAKDNYLVIKRNEIFQRVKTMIGQPLSMFGQLRFADNKTKTFKKLMFEFKNARLAYYKDAKISQPLGMWNIEDITWYLGAESRRPLPNNIGPKLSLTFIECNAVVARGTKESPYFGHTIAFSSEEELNKWIASMVIGQYSSEITPRNECPDLL